MKKIQDVDVPDNISDFISVQISRLIRTPYFSYQDKDDLWQEFWLFYFQSLKNIPVNDPRTSEGYFFMAIKNKAAEILRSRRRFTHYSYEMESDVAINHQSFEDTHDVENKNMVNAMFQGLTEREQRVLLMIMGDATTEEIAREVKMSKHTIYELLRRLKKNFIF